MNPSRHSILATLVLVAAIAFGSAPAPAADPGRNDALFQYSTANALLHGLYDGDMTFADLGRRGDTGIGTFNRLDGEMIGLDGAFFQIRSDGRAYTVTPDRRTPFAIVTFFHRDRQATLPGGLSYDDLLAFIDRLQLNRNHFQAIRIDGRFARVKVRSAPAQTPPYRPLAAVIKDQVVFDYADIRGTLIGFRTPAYVAGLGIPGYHLHFIDAARQRGGHVLGLETADGATLAIDDLAEFDVALPGSAAFAATDLTGKRSKEIEQVEKGR